MAKKYIFILCIIFGLALIAFIHYRVKEGFENPDTVFDIPVIKDVWVINLDKSTDRWKNMLDELKSLEPIPVNRWSAIDGRALTEQNYVEEKIPITVRPEFALEAKQERRKGEIGCYLSHKKLLENLGKQTVDDDAGRLILEDDVEINSDILNKWVEVASNLDKDWDIFFFGIHDPILDDVKNGIAKVKSIQSLHAYMVRQKSIPKILEIIKIMYDPIDEIIRWNSDKLNLYAIQPFVISQKANYMSDIHGKVT